MIPGCGCSVDTDALDFSGTERCGLEKIIFARLSTSNEFDAQAKKDANGLITEAGDMVIYAAGFPAIYGKQPLYFKDPVFIARASIEAPEQSDILRARLTKDEEIRL